MPIYAKDRNSARHAASMTRERLYYAIRVEPTGEWLFSADKERIKEDILDFLDKGRSYEIKVFQVQW